jgi:HEAT repeat protein
MNLEDDAIEGYQNILQDFKDNPEYAENSNYDLESIFFDARFSSSQTVRRLAIQTLGRIGATREHESIETCLLNIENTDENATKYALVVALIRLTNRNCSIRALALIDSLNWFEEWNIGGGLGGKEIINTIVASQNQDFLEFLHEAIKQRKWSSDHGAFDIFTEILGAINALGNNESEKVILSLLDSCDDQNVANQLVLTLGFVGGTKSVSKLRDIIFNHDMKSMPQYPSIHMVWFASCSLGRLGDSESVERMIELWNNGYESPFIARAFGLLKDERCISVLITGTASQKANVVAGSILALSDIGGNEERKHLLHLYETGPIEHIIEKNSENCRIGKFDKKQIMASLFLAMDRVGEKIESRRLQKSIETLRESMGHGFEDWFL